MRIAVTGAAGFIASQVAEAYLRVGHEVMIVDDLSTGRRENLPAAARFVEADIRSSAASAALTSFRPQVLNHHAAQMDVRRSVADPKLDAEINLIGFLNLLEAVRQGGCQRVIFASSGGAAYGEQEQFPANEQHPTRPASPYGVSKRAGELYLACFGQMYGISHLALRYANVYGPRQNPRGEAGVVAIFTQRLLAGEPCTIYGDGKQTRDFVFVDDVVAANVAALDARLVGEVNIGTGKEADINQIYSELARITKRHQAVRYADGKVGEQRRSVVAVAKAAAELNWHPRISLSEGLERTVAYFKHTRSAAA